MLKKFLAFTVTALLSAEASASYTKYEFGGLLDGFFVQRDDNQAIAHFSFNMTTLMHEYYDPEYYSGPVLTRLWTHQFFPLFGDGAKLLIGATTNFGKDGPTNFQIYDDWAGDQRTSFSINFSRISQNGFAYTVDYSRWAYMDGGYSAGEGTFSGLVMKVPLSPSLAADLDLDGGYYSGMPRIIPEYIGQSTEVPEPFSLALMSIGAISAYGVARRRKTFPLLPLK